jgi:hypothetical protein
MWGIKVRSRAPAKARGKPPGPPARLHRAAESRPLQVNQLIMVGQWWRLITPAFLHGSVMHLAVNSMSLNNLGPAVEGTTGHARFVAIYGVAALAGTAASFFFSAAPSLGASGARCACAGGPEGAALRIRCSAAQRPAVALVATASELLARAEPT